MKKHILVSLKLTAVFIIICSVIYPLVIAAVARLAPGGGRGQTLPVNGKAVGYANVGQKFDRDNYFWSRPSAVGYNAAGSGGSNKGPTNPDYLKDVQARIDSFLAHNPGVRKDQIPAELVTYSGSGLDPDLSPAGAKIQIPRIAAARHISEQTLRDLVDQHTEHPFVGMFGPSKVNVLQLNIALDNLK
ncbi:MAG: potassium-transporting ATPase subunit C [Sphingobacteriales bacterium 50-39]|nr:K(+)-transporting ATPase subunit C [Sphingobacteriales bacterium]OJW55809.1 MAG: potassium-transporting ATPase subunit C [Sphingobacteriales bacterium 50-39]